MAISYPGSPPGSATDTFSTPSNPAGTPLSEAGSNNNRDLTQSIEDLGLAVTAVESWATLRTHDHSGDGTSTATGKKLNQSNTHQAADTDASNAALHHTIGPGQYQVAAGNHVHDYSVITNTPYRICTSTTHPVSPFPGLMVFETDTNFLRIWANTGSGFEWQVIPFLQVPIVQLQQGSPQALSSPGWVHLLWDDVVNDTANFFNSALDATQIIVRNTGLYATNLAVQFDPAIAPDVASVAMFVNGALSSIQSNVFQRGEEYVPGFSQTVSAQGPIRLNSGDVVTGAVSYVASQGLGVVNTFVNQAESAASRISLAFAGT